MSDGINYNETVVIPFLQKKFQELTNQNLVLEVNLLIERQKNAQLEKDLEEAVSKLGKEDKKKKKGEAQVLDASTY
jgi:hypothetical protein